MNVSFNSIPINLLVPGAYIEVDNSKMNKGLTILPAKVLVIGQKLAAGTALALKPYLITSADQAKQLFGVGSQLAQMMERFKGANTFSEVWAISQVDNGAGAAATGTIVITGTSTAAGTLNVWIGGRRVQIAVPSGMTAAQAATALVAAITAATDLPCTASAAVGTVTLTAKHKGEAANFIDVRLNYYQDETTPAGLVITPPTGFSGGTGNPDVNAALDAIGDEWYTDLVCGYTDSANLVALEAELTERFGPLKMIDGHLFNARSDSHANLVTAGQSRNKPHITSFGVYKPLNPPYEIAAMTAAVCVSSLEIDPARPVQRMPVPGMLAPALEHRFKLEERNILLSYGIATLDVGADGTVYIERAVTNYRTNSYGLPDPSFRDIETMKTITYLRYDLRTMIAQRYPRYKLADDGTDFARGQNVVTPSVIRASIIARFRMWEQAGLVENIDQFIEDIIVVRDESDPNRVNAIIPPDLINQLRVFAGQLQPRL